MTIKTYWHLPAIYDISTPQRDTCKQLRGVYNSQKLLYNEKTWLITLVFTYDVLAEMTAFPKDVLIDGTSFHINYKKIVNIFGGPICYIIIQFVNYFF